MSIINVPYQHVFVHVPKTAGTSMELHPFVGGSSHDSIHQMAQLPDYNPDFFRWAFSRNPYGRIASAYFYVKSRHQEQISKFYDPDGTFECFVMNLEKSLPDDPYNHELTFPDHNIHIIPQFYFVNSPLVTNIFVGKYEKLINDWKSVVIKIHMGRILSQKYLKLQHVNKTQDKPYSIISLYTPEMARKVYDIYYGDFQTLGYERWKL